MTFGVDEISFDYLFKEIPTNLFKIKYFNRWIFRVL
jgi:hypothetical protein